MSKKSKTGLFVLVTIMLSLVLGIFSCSGKGLMITPTYGYEQIRGDMGRLADSSCGGQAQRVRYYFDIFDLDPERDIAGVEHFFGSFDSGDFNIAGHIYRPKEYKATVVLVHGYLNHTGQLTHLIRFLLASGYAVCAYDMPGHGLSSGEGAWIDDFEKYAQVLDDFKPLVAEKCAGPYHVIGFSHGCCAIIQRELEGVDDFFDKTVLAAPLVHPVQWKKARATYRLYWFFKKDVPRVLSRNSSDKSFLAFNRDKDFLHVQRVPLIWVRGLEKWNRKIDSLGPCEREVMIVQGDRDKTVEWTYNTKLLEMKFNVAKCVMIEGGKHELFNEKEVLKDKVFAEIGSYLEDNSI